MPVRNIIYLSIIFLLLGFPIQLKSQDTQKKGISYTFNDTLPVKLDKELNVIQSIAIPDKIKPDFGVEIGSSFMFGGNRSMLNNYINPHASFNPADKLHLSVGTFFMMSTLPANLISAETVNAQPGRNLSSAYIHGSAEYLINEKLSIRGTFFYEIDPFNKNQFQQNTKSLNSHYYSIGMDYKINKNIQIGVEFSQVKTDDPFFLYNTNPFGNRSGLRHPFDY
ncbi:hypothetical protein ACFLSI_02185 [Bacteroidota bacterium]